MSIDLVIQLSDAQLDHIAARVAELLASQRPLTAPIWLDAAGAAEHIATTRERVYDLVQLGKIEPRRDGRRLLFRASDLDRYLEESR